MLFSARRSSAARSLSSWMVFAAASRCSADWADNLGVGLLCLGGMGDAGCTRTSIADIPFDLNGLSSFGVDMRSRVSQAAESV